jgi:hypothetical protein
LVSIMPRASLAFAIWNLRFGLESRVKSRGLSSVCLLNEIHD